MFSPFLLLDVLAVTLTPWLLWRVFSRRYGRHLPPGPKGWPIIGNLLDVPQEQEWVTYSQWNDKWGE
jgi:hypothetical protein